MKESTQLKDLLNEIIYSSESTLSHRKLAEFIMGNYTIVAFMTAAEIAKEANVSQPTVTRFVSDKLGYEGFSQFLKSVQEIVRTEITGVDRHQIVSDKKKSSVEEVLDKDIKSLSKLKEELTDEKIEYLAKKIAESKSVIIVGYRTGSHLANYFYFFLNKIHPNVFLYDKEGIEVYEKLQAMGTESTIILNFLFPRYSKPSIEVIDYLKQHNFNYLTFTDNDSLELWGITQCDLIMPINITTLFDSYVTSYAILNILLNEIGKVDLVATESMLRQTERLFEQLNYLYKK